MYEGKNLLSLSSEQPYAPSSASGSDSHPAMGVPSVDRTRWLCGQGPSGVPIVVLPFDWRLVFESGVEAATVVIRPGRGPVRCRGRQGRGVRDGAIPVPRWGQELSTWAWSVEAPLVVNRSQHPHHRIASPHSQRPDTQTRGPTTPNPQTLSSATSACSHDWRLARRRRVRSFPAIRPPPISTFAHLNTLSGPPQIAGCAFASSPERDCCSHMTMSAIANSSQLDGCLLGSVAGPAEDLGIPFRVGSRLV